MSDSRKVAKKLVAIATMLSVESALNGCIAATSMDDDLLIWGSDEAVRAWADHEAQLIVTGKASTDEATEPYYKLREAQIRKVKDMRRRVEK